MIGLDGHASVAINDKRNGDLMRIGELDCWIVSEGTIGMEVQCLGLAEALGATPRLHRIAPNPILRLFPSWGRLPGIAPARHADPILAPPWPDLLITCGRRHAGASIAIRRLSRGKTFTVHLQDPRIDPGHFDLLVLPEHDPTRGDNVITTVGSLNRLTETGLAEAAAGIADRLSGLPRPLVAVLIGGGMRGRPVPDEKMHDLATALRRLVEDAGVGLLVTASRRTAPHHQELLRTALEHPAVWFWDGTGDNPYLGFLGAADTLLVTADSVNMVSEACTTGKPVQLIELVPPTGRLARFHADMAARGLTRPFTGALDAWRYEPLAESHRVAPLILERLHRRHPDLDDA